MQYSSALVMAFAAAASAATHKVTVGANGLLAYSPNNTVAAPGDTVEFDFFPKNRTLPIVFPALRNHC
jgi:plastocyanin